ncbi:MAG: hypothetical protein U9N87_12755 [Planctomycetota bacterium]|nr:hypothetical protein [Planctomycetota bacterium]
MPESNWNAKGASLSDKTARGEYDLTQEEILAAISEGKLQYRENHIHGNPYLRLLRAEVEALVNEKHGAACLSRLKLQTELKSVKSQIRSLKTELKGLEKRKTELLDELDDD